MLEREYGLEYDLSGVGVRRVRTGEHGGLLLAAAENGRASRLSGETSSGCSCVGQAVQSFGHDGQIEV